MANTDAGERKILDRMSASERRFSALLIAFDARERSTIENGLRVAAEIFDEHAGAAWKAGLSSIAEQFERQAKESREILELVES